MHLNASRSWNEANWGLGLEREFPSRSRWVKLAMANGFEDSRGYPSYMAGAGLKRRFELGTSDFYVDLGGIAFLMTRDDVDHNRPFPGVLPAATFGFRRVALNLTYLPEVAVDRVTNAKRRDPTLDGVIFLQLKLDASLLGFGNRQQRRQFLAQESSTP
jgi:hypothetical protein